MDVSNHTQSATSQSDSQSSSNSELDKDLAELSLNGRSNGDKSDDIENGTGSAGSIASNTLKKRVSSSRTPTRKAKRVRFFRNGDRFYGGIMIPVSYERYR